MIIADDWIPLENDQAWATTSWAYSIPKQMEKWGDNDAIHRMIYSTTAEVQCGLSKKCLQM